MKTKRTTTSNYYHATFQDGGYWEYRVYQIFPHELVDGGIVNSRRDAAECARAAIRRLEAGTHHTQQVAA